MSSSSAVTTVEPPVKDMQRGENGGPFLSKMPCFCPSSATTSPPVKDSQRGENGGNGACKQLHFQSNGVEPGEGCSLPYEGISSYGSQKVQGVFSNGPKKVELVTASMPWDFDMLESKKAIPPWDHDILLLDINKSILETTVSRVLSRQYLQPWVGPSTQWPVTGKMFGVNYLMMACLSTSLSALKAAEIGVEPVKIAVHYLVDTGAPSTYLCEDAVQALSPAKRFYYDEYMRIPVVIHGFKHHVHLCPLGSHFKDVSLIGSDLLALIQGTLIADYGEAQHFSIARGPGIYESTDY